MWYLSGKAQIIFKSHHPLPRFPSRATALDPSCVSFLYPHYASPLRLSFHIYDRPVMCTQDRRGTARWPLFPWQRKERESEGWSQVFSSFGLRDVQVIKGLVKICNCCSRWRELGQRNILINN